jgi:hypothetical protein
MQVVLKMGENLSKFRSEEGTSSKLVSCLKFEDDLAVKIVPGSLTTMKNTSIYLN